MTEKSTTLHLAWEEAGQGIPVVLLHGFPFCRDIFAPVMPALAHVGRVAAVDLPGFGQSPPLAPGFSLADVAKEVIAFLQALGLQRTVLVGHSMGGYVALELAAQKPEALAGLVLLASHPRGDTPEAKAKRQEGIETIRQGRRAEFLEGFLARLPSPWTRQHAPRLLQEVRAMAEAVSDQVLVSFLQAMAERKDHTETVRKLEVPVGVVVGEADALIPRELARETAAQAPRGSLIVVPEAGHLPTLEKPVFTAEALARLVREAEG
ncbi:MAG: alpha/beta fold hydrolase [Thermoanaerobaculum sp.]